MGNDTFTTLSVCFTLCMIFSIYNWHKYFEYKKKHKDASIIEAKSDFDKEVDAYTGTMHKHYLRFSITTTVFTVLTFIAILCSYLDVLKMM